MCSLAYGHHDTPRPPSCASAPPVLPDRLRTHASTPLSHATTTATHTLSGAPPASAPCATTPLTQRLPGTSPYRSTAANRMAGPSSTSAAAAAQGSGAASGMRDQQGQYQQHQQQAMAGTPGATGATGTSSSNSKLAAFEVLEVIGQGSFGKVCRVRRIADSKVRHTYV